MGKEKTLSDQDVNFEFPPVVTLDDEVENKPLPPSSEAQQEPLLPLDDLIQAQIDVVDNTKLALDEAIFNAAKVGGLDRAQIVVLAICEEINEIIANSPNEKILEEQITHLDLKGVTQKYLIKNRDELVKIFKADLLINYDINSYYFLTREALTVDINKFFTQEKIHIQFQYFEEALVLYKNLALQKFYLKQASSINKALTPNEKKSIVTFENELKAIQLKEKEINHEFFAANNAYSIALQNAKNPILLANQVGLDLDAIQSNINHFPVIKELDRLIALIENFQNIDFSRTESALEQQKNDATDVKSKREKIKSHLGRYFSLSSKFDSFKNQIIDKMLAINIVIRNHEYPYRKKIRRSWKQELTNFKKLKLNYSQNFDDSIIDQQIFAEKEAFDQKQKSFNEFKTRISQLKHTLPLEELKEVRAQCVKDIAEQINLVKKNAKNNSVPVIVETQPPGFFRRHLRAILGTSAGYLLGGTLFVVGIAFSPFSFGSSLTFSGLGLGLIFASAGGGAMIGGAIGHALDYFFPINETTPNGIAISAATSAVQSTIKPISTNNAFLHRIIGKPTAPIDDPENTFADNLSPAPADFNQTNYKPNMFSGTPSGIAVKESCLTRVINYFKNRN